MRYSETEQYYKYLSYTGETWQEARERVKNKRKKQKQVNKIKNHG